MSKVRAFVGHSFTPDDDILNGKFLNFFRQLSGYESDLFSWEHALAAEPKDLLVKVLGMLEDKNTFIGICTKKEWVIDDGNLKIRAFIKNILYGKADRFQWKTSDWVIQEIGLAIGKGLQIILLVEKGLRRPGGLQGNLEYIEFNREHPEESFGRVVEMIRATAPKEAGLSAAPTTKNALVVSKAQDDQEKDEFPRIPQTDWKEHDYQKALFHCLFSRDSDDASRIFEAYLTTEQGGLVENSSVWMANFELLKILFSIDGSLSKLKTIADEFAKNSEIQGIYPRGLSHFNEGAKAAEAFKRAATLANDEDSKMRLLAEAASMHVGDNHIPAARQVLADMKTLFNSFHIGEVRLLRVIKEIADKKSDTHTGLAVIERIVELTPGNIDNLFAAAFEQSESENNELAILHYLKIPPDRRSAAAWNNIGVAFSLLPAKGKSVSAYRKAKEMGETLAMANIAEVLISAGFYEEAMAECQTAFTATDYHKNVTKALAKLKDLPDTEAELIDESRNKAKPVSEFYRLYGRSLNQPDVLNSTSQWHGPDCVLEVKIFETNFIATGSYDEALGLLGG